ncbi:MAG TPA: hypothetical protein VLY63_12600 [Anaerolineae bacterium]|nr:hypothetical protein [Anaerolineae bacterium]
MSIFSNHSVMISKALPSPPPYVLIHCQLEAELSAAILTGLQATHDMMGIGHPDLLAWLEH